MSAAGACVSVFLDEDGDVPSFVEALCRLLGRGLTMSLTLSSRADEAFSQQIHAAFNGDSRIVIHDSEPCRFAAQSEFQISNDLVALSTQKKSPLPRYLFGQGRFCARVGSLFAGPTSTSSAARRRLHTACSKPGSLRVSSMSLDRQQHIPPTWSSRWSASLSLSPTK